MSYDYIVIVLEARLRGRPSAGAQLWRECPLLEAGGSHRRPLVDIPRAHSDDVRQRRLFGALQFPAPTLAWRTFGGYGQGNLVGGGSSVKR